MLPKFKSNTENTNKNDTQEQNETLKDKVKKLKNDASNKLKSSKKYPFYHRTLFYSDIENLFKKSIDITTFFDDPLFIYPFIKIDVDSSPLWNFGHNDKINSNTPLYFIKKYSAIKEINVRQKILKEFLSKIEMILPTTTSNEKNIIPRYYYIQQITGFDKLNDKIVDYEKNVLTITLYENVSLFLTYIAELYNNLIYSYSHQKYLIPENLLRFDLLIEFKDIRNFKKVIQDKNGKLKSVIDKDIPRIIYKLHDCNFIFFETSAINNSNQINGFGNSSFSISNLSFSIKYRSVTKEFYSPLISNSLYLNNKSKNIIINKNIETSSIYFSEDIYNEEKHNEILFKEKSDKKDNIHIPHVKTNNGYNLSVFKFPTLGYVNQELHYKHGDHNHSAILITSNDKIMDNIKHPKSLLNMVKSEAKNVLNMQKKMILSKFNQLRGQLLDNIYTAVKKKLHINTTYLGNVYKDDLTKISLERFYNELSGQVLYTLEDKSKEKINDKINELVQNLYKKK